MITSDDLRVNRRQPTKMEVVADEQISPTPGKSQVGSPMSGTPHRATVFGKGGILGKKIVLERPIVITPDLS